MAKISADGDYEVARIRTQGGRGFQYIWVITGKGRVLRRAIGEAGTGYTIYRRGWKGDKSKSVLAEMARAAGHKVLP